MVQEQAARQPEQPLGSGFLRVPEPTPEIQHLYDEDVEVLGFVMNVSRVWAQQPSAHERVFELLGEMIELAGLTMRQRGILVTSCASTLGDSCCAYAWGWKLSREADASVAASLLSRDDSVLDASEQALARWARKVVRNPNATSANDVQELRDAGFDDRQIFAVTVFIAMRLAFATVNDALGAQPDAELADLVAPEIRAAVTYGRPVAEV
jgi:alkylhydroperoxidase family enzyme